ncbi:MAG: 6-phosphofructokinase [Oscillospiraceae bacterium]|jgi:6-phosphofructokinase 1|nr:6-phosphofructokinase [Oscillospiraceae bacterium]
MSKTLVGACIFAQSGGPTAVINASAYGVIKTAIDAPEITHVYGAANGIVGVINDVLYDMNAEDAYELSLLPYTPSSELGSCRYKLKDPREVGADGDYAKILNIFRKYDVRYFFYNGGNDSMDTCAKISRYFAEVGYECRVLGIPKTIDNDLCGTDHSPGYGSAAKYIATSVAEIHKDNNVYDTGSVAIVETMGRHAGWLAGSAALARLTGAGADLIYLPEIAFDMEKFVDSVKSVYDIKKKCLVVVSEGISYADGSFVSEAKTSASDGFMHAQLGGLAAVLADVVKQRLGVKVRGIELSLLQRCGAHIASKRDIDEAQAAGEFAVRAAINGESGKMVSLRRAAGEAYECGCELQPIEAAANNEKKVPREWINADGNDVTQEFIDYALPLIQGETERPTENGLPRFARLKKLPPKNTMV